MAIDIMVLYEELLGCASASCQHGGHEEPVDVDLTRGNTSERWDQDL